MGTKQRVGRKRREIEREKNGKGEGRKEEKGEGGLPQNNFCLWPWSLTTVHHEYLDCSRMTG